MKVTVRIPASTSNLGPGFDCLGVALQIYNDVTIERCAAGRLSPMARAAGRLFFTRAKTHAFPFACSITGDVPASRGLGSSVTVRLGVLFGLNQLVRSPLSRKELFHLCAELEGHPDNAAPGAFGGFNVTHGLARQRFTVQSCLKFVLLIPNVKIETSDARAILPERISRRDAVESSANACAIVAAFASARYHNLRGAFGDYLHQPFRARLLPFLDDVITAAEGAGALGAFLSGSGSTVAAITLGSTRRVAGAMLRAMPTAAAQVRLTTADNRGARILPG